MQSTATPEASSPKGSNVESTFGLVALLTIVSKIVGFARDVIVLQIFGTTAVADAYNYALLFTGNILILFGGLGGPFHSATVAVLSKDRDKVEAGALITQVIAVTLVLLSIVAFILFWQAPHIVQWIGKDYPGSLAAHETFISETVQQLRWMSPLVVIAGLIGIVYGILNVYDKIFWPSLSPLIASLAIIIGVKFFVDPTSPAALPLSIATLIGAFGQLLVQMPDLFKCNLHWRLSIKPDHRLKEYLLMLGPACFSTLIGQLTTYVDSMFAGQMSGQGDWTAIVNANRLVQLPLGILATAMLVPMLPRFSQLAKDNNNQGIKLDYKKAFTFLIFLSMPIAALLISLPEPIVTVLFKRNNFNARSVNLVGEALWWLAPSIMCYLGRDLITRVFYAFKDSRTPFLVALIAITVKYWLDWFFVTRCHWSVGGISLATSCITVLNLSLLTFFLRRKIGKLHSITMLKPVATMLAGGIACGIISGSLFLAWENTFAFTIGATSESATRESVTRESVTRRSKHLSSYFNLSRTTGSQFSFQNGRVSLLHGTESNFSGPIKPSPESWLSLALGLILSSTAGLVTYLLICLFGKLDEIALLRRRLTGQK
jgi:putative peptidoglycan lipid II flippase